MSLEMWILMVGLRVVDLGALVVWLVWFHRQCDKDDDDGDGGGDFGGQGGEPDDPPAPVGGRELDLPLADAEPWPSRRRDHSDVTWPPPAPVRRAPEPDHVPARQPASLSWPA